VTITLRLASSETDKAAIYRLRYRCYVEDQGLFVDEADHERGWMTDEDDRCSHLLMAEEEGVLLGTLRVTTGQKTTFRQRLRSDYQLARFAAAVPEHEIAVVTRLLVDPRCRRTNMVNDLIAMGFALAVRDGAALIVGSCEPHLVNRNLRLGFRTYGDVNARPRNSTVVRIAFPIGDHDHLRQIGSPLLQTCLGRPAPCPRLEEIASVIDREPAIVSETNLGALAFGWVLRHVLGPLPADHFLADDDLARALSTRSHLLRVQSHGSIVCRGQVPRNVLVLLAGALRITDESGRSFLVDRPGALLGTDAFLSGGRRAVDIDAGPEGAQVLFLEERNTRQLWQEVFASVADWIVPVITREAA